MRFFSKITRTIFFFLFLNTILLGLILFPHHPPKNLEVIFFDIGRGDSILIKTPYQQKILIDGGLDKTILNKLGKHLPFWDREINLIILTHPHGDHLNGLIEVLRRYKVGQVLETGIPCFQANCEEWKRVIKEKNILTQIATMNQLTEMGRDLKLLTLWPTEEILTGLNQKEEMSHISINNTSIVNKLIYKNVSFLFAGDLEWEGEEMLLNKFPKEGLRADVLKVAHHGGSTSSTEKFLEAVQSEWAVISVEKENKKMVPSLRVLKRLERLGMKVLRTDQNGDIKIITDGESIDIFLER